MFTNVNVTNVTKHETTSISSC